MEISKTARAPRGRLLFVALLLELVVPLTLVACRTDASPPPPAGVVPTLVDASACGSACEGLRRAGCREGFPRDSGTECIEVCKLSAEKRGWPLQCWTAANTRQEVIDCGPQTRCVPLR